MMTVRDLITELQKYDLDLPVGTEDAQFLDYVSQEDYEPLDGAPGWKPFVALKFEE